MTGPRNKHLIPPPHPPPPLKPSALQFLPALHCSWAPLHHQTAQIEAVVASFSLLSSSPHLPPPHPPPPTLPPFSLCDRLLPDWPGPDIVQRNVRVPVWPVCADKGASEEGAAGGSQGQEMSVWDACVAPAAAAAGGHTPEWWKPLSHTSTISFYSALIHVFNTKHPGYWVLLAI